MDRVSFDTMDYKEDQYSLYWTVQYGIVGRVYLVIHEELATITCFYGVEVNTSSTLRLSVDLLGFYDGVIYHGYRPFWGS